MLYSALFNFPPFLNITIEKLLKQSPPPPKKLWPGVCWPLVPTKFPPPIQPCRPRHKMTPQPITPPPPGLGGLIEQILTPLKMLTITTIVTVKDQIESLRSQPLEIRSSTTLSKHH